MSDQEKTEGCGDKPITASEIVEQSLAAVGKLNIDGPEAVAAAVSALNDMGKAGAVRIRLPNSYTVVGQHALLNPAQVKAADLDGNPYPFATTATSVPGWDFMPYNLARHETHGNLVRARDGMTIPSSVNANLWPKQILDFEHAEGVQWSSAMKPVQVPTTPEMVAIGARRLRELDEGYTYEYRALEAYQVMRPLERAGAMTVLEHQALEAMRRERDEARAARDRSSAEWEKLWVLTTRRTLERDEASERVAYLEAVVHNMPNAESVKVMLAEKDAEIAHLHDQLKIRTDDRNAWSAQCAALLTELGRRPLCLPASTAAEPPKLKHDPFKDHGHDHRRMGPI